MARSEALKKQVNELWKQAVDQLEDVKDAVLRSTNRFETEVLRLRSERDKLLRRLGEQAFSLASTGNWPLPSLMKRTADRLGDVIERMTEQSKRNGQPLRDVEPVSMAGAAKKARKTPARSGKKTTKKSTRRPSADGLQG